MRRSGGLLFVSVSLLAPLAARGGPAGGAPLPAPASLPLVHGLVVREPPSTTVPVPAGPFTMGAMDDEIAGEVAECQAALGPAGACSTAFDDQRPARRIYLAGFAIDRMEVTRAEYEDCVVAGACEPGPLAYPSPDAARPRAPVTLVTWDDAVAYCAFRGERLPTEAEWEKAARGERAFSWPWGDRPRLDAFNHGRVGGIDGPLFDASDGALLAADAGTFPQDRSPYGALDMAGNVREWVADWYGQPNAGELVDPRGPKAGEERVVRGGSFLAYPFEGQTEWRFHVPPETRAEDIGFRCAR